MKKFVFSALAVGIIATSMIGLSYAVTSKYPDLTWTAYRSNGTTYTAVHHAKREIEQATSIGIMEGYPDGTFKPDDNITRSEFIKILIGLATNRTFDFSNVDSEYKTWYGPYLTIAEMQGIVDKGQYTEKELDEPITRIEMIFMLAKTTINMKGKPLTQVGNINNYTDISNYTKDEKDLIRHAAQYDLLEGMRDGTSTLLEPNKNLTRGEAAKALMNVY